ncbi:hypothetical protein [Levilactobacillus tujiorum]|uniref:GW domain-containing protein n=1 Tax=Levilactobacillus tujiorum TaxID=2912243 RepID=A0ABX1L458_9LACO|nr:hypothetical protein [Levilactobacillus tujiorum]MCH5465216.1 hypothetical protein [Levilactobacillus tujiorum]NLR12227.1 hypothetical protein [Lactobacillus sp. HBUAS51387]NLR29805.1 hypothetical protein [Levilactobacillus tujiorum]
MRWAKFILAGSLGLALWGSVTTAHAAKRVTLPAYPQQRIFTFKVKGTSVYRSAHSAAVHGTILGIVHSQKKKWTVDKVVKIHGKRYVRLDDVTAGELQHGSVVRPSSVSPVAQGEMGKTLDGGYVALSKLKFRRQISQLKSLKKTAYWRPTLTHDFWDMPELTLGTTTAIHYGTSHGYQTLYAIQSLTTKAKKHYLYFETAKGKALGWLPASAVVKGTYPNLVKRELTRGGLQAKNTVTTLDAKAHIKIGIATANDQIQRVVMVKQNSQTVIYDYQEGRAVHQTTRSAAGKVLSSKAITPVKTLKFSLNATFDLQGTTYEGTISPTGKIDIPVYTGWIA